MAEGGHKLKTGIWPTCVWQPEHGQCSGLPTSTGNTDWPPLIPTPSKPIVSATTPVISITTSSSQLSSIQPQPTLSPQPSSSSSDNESHSSTFTSNTVVSNFSSGSPSLIPTNPASTITDTYASSVSQTSYSQPTEISSGHTVSQSQSRSSQDVITITSSLVTVAYSESTTIFPTSGPSGVSEVTKVATLSSTITTAYTFTSTSSGALGLVPSGSITANAASQASKSKKTGEVLGGIFGALAILLLLLFALLWHRKSARRRRAARESIWFGPTGATAATSGLLNRSTSDSSSFFFTAEDDIMGENNQATPTYRYGATPQALATSTRLVVSPPLPSAQIRAEDPDPFADPAARAREQTASVVTAESPTIHVPLPNPYQDLALFPREGQVAAWDSPLHSARNSLAIHPQTDVRVSVLSERSGDVESVEAM